jgi:hypothetical protein
MMSDWPAKPFGFGPQPEARDVTFKVRNCTFCAIKGMRGRCGELSFVSVVKTSYCFWRLVVESCESCRSVLDTMPVWALISVKVNFYRGCLC